MLCGFRDDGTVRMAIISHIRTERPHHDLPGCPPAPQDLPQARGFAPPGPPPGDSLHGGLPHAPRQDVRFPGRRLHPHRGPASRPDQSVFRPRLLEADRSAGPVAGRPPGTRGPAGRDLHLRHRPDVLYPAGPTRPEHLSLRQLSQAAPQEQPQAKEDGATVGPLLRDGAIDHPQRHPHSVLDQLLHQGLLQGEEARFPHPSPVGRPPDSPTARTRGRG